MAESNRITTINKQAAMAADLSNAAEIINQSATGFLFAATMANGEMRWFAGGDLLAYDNKTAAAAMRLYVEAQNAALKTA